MKEMTIERINQVRVYFLSLQMGQQPEVISQKIIDTIMDMAFICTKKLEDEWFDEVVEDIDVSVEYKMLNLLGRYNHDSMPEL